MSPTISNSMVPKILYRPGELKKLGDKLDYFLRSQVLRFSEESNGQNLLKNLKIPYMKMDIPSFDHEGMLIEAIGLEKLAVPHRSNDGVGWKSLCIHGLDATKTGSFDDYGYSDERLAPYGWTWVAEKTPQITAYIRQLLELQYFSELHRVRLMYLSPGGFINFHRDRPEGQNSLGPLNIALNMPSDCHWLFEEWGRVPFYGGVGMAVDVSYVHGVWNCSNLNRVHLIIHGTYGEGYYRCLSRSFKNLRKTLDQSSIEIKKSFLNFDAFTTFFEKIKNAIFSI